MIERCLEWFLESVDFRMYAFCTVVLTLLIMSAIIYFRTGETDTVYEEIVEEIIKQQTGITIDLSPSTPEYIYY